MRRATSPGYTAAAAWCIHAAALEGCFAAWGGRAAIEYPRR